MKTKILTSSIVLISILLSECKKYEEGPTLSLRSKQHRIEGEWDITSYTVNGENELASTNDYSYACSTGTVFHAHDEYNTTRFVWNFDKNDWNYSQTETSKVFDQQFAYYNCIATYDYDTDTYLEGGTWKLLSGKEKIEITSQYGDIMTFKIIELREKEMKLEGNDGGSIVKMTFAKR